MAVGQNFSGPLPGPRFFDPEQVVGKRVVIVFGISGDHDLSWEKSDLVMN